MSSASPSPVLVTAGVIERDGRFLVCQRRTGDHHAGKWEFPGGKVEPAEDLKACLQRELREELGIEAEVGEELWRSRQQYPGRPLFEIVFLSIVDYGGSITNRGFADVRWVSREQLGVLDFLEGDLELVAMLAQGRHSDD